ncbi:hypothetical protein LCGC14_2465160, partial [marine sediment metagenome]
MYSIYAVAGFAIYYDPVFKQNRKFYLHKTVRAISEREAKLKHELNIRYEFPFTKSEIKKVKITKCE